MRLSVGTKIRPIVTKITVRRVYIGANLAESKGARTDADYRSKISIALNEANEALYWLELLTCNNEIEPCEAKEIDALLNEAIGMLIATRKKVDERK